MRRRLEWRPYRPIEDAVKARYDGAHHLAPWSASLLTTVRRPEASKVPYTRVRAWENVGWVNTEAPVGARGVTLGKEAEGM
jgi:hypothetical protein